MAALLGGLTAPLLATRYLALREQTRVARLNSEQRPPQFRLFLLSATGSAIALFAAWTCLCAAAYVTSTAFTLAAVLWGVAARATPVMARALAVDRDPAGRRVRGARDDECRDRRVE